MNKFTTSIVRLDYDEPVALSDVLRINVRGYFGNHRRENGKPLV